MHDILRKLSQKNLFNYKKMDSSNMDFDDDASLGTRFQIYIFGNLFAYNLKRAELFLAELYSVKK